MIIIIHVSGPISATTCSFMGQSVKFCSLPFQGVLVSYFLHQAWNSLKDCLSESLDNLSIHVSCCSLLGSMALLRVFIYSLINYLSSFLIISKCLGDPKVFLSSRLTRVMYLYKHFSVNFLWLSKSAIFFIRYLPFHSSDTFSLLNSPSICKCKLLILFDCINKYTNALQSFEYRKQKTEHWR